jgi:hypothetical protein
MDAALGEPDPGDADRGRVTVRRSPMISDTVAVTTAVTVVRRAVRALIVWMNALVRLGAPPGTRTPNPRIKSPLLCQLS